MHQQMNLSTQFHPIHYLRRLFFKSIDIGGNEGGRREGYQTSVKAFSIVFSPHVSPLGPRDQVTVRYGVTIVVYFRPIVRS